jgi:hypothetical protein
VPGRHTRVECADCEPEVSRTPSRLDALVVCLDSYAGRYESLKGVRSFGEYVALKGDRADEELLTEPLLAMILERVLDFPTDAYFRNSARAA